MVGAVTVYTAHARGTVWRETHCYFCRCVYFYRMTRVSTGSGNTDEYASADEAQRAAQRLADERLHNLLTTDFDFVPCPQCGCYQPEMCVELRELECDSARKRSNALIGLTGLCFVAAVWCFFPGPQRDGLDVIQIPAAVLGLLLLIPAAIAHQRYNEKRDSYDANAGPAERRFKIARKRALTAAQLKERLKAETLEGPKPWAKGVQDAE